MNEAIRFNLWSGYKFIDDSIDIDESMKVISDLCDDMHELLRVAQYNLTGEFNGQVGDIPEPQLIHQKGIDKSRAIMEEGKKLWRKLHKVKEAMKNYETN